MRLDRALNFTPKLWDQVGQFVRGAIKDDALRGIMQDDKRPKLRSNQYKKYKKKDYNSTREVRVRTYLRNKI